MCLCLSNIQIGLTIENPCLLEKQKYDQKKNVPLVAQVLPTILEHPSSPPVPMGLVLRDLLFDVYVL